MDEQLGRGLDYVPRQMCVSFHGVLCVFDKENFYQGSGVAT
jgi:hypothetical protein